MSDNIPFDIQREIIKRVSNIKSLIQLRSVSKQWKSFIDSSEFIKGYGARHTHPHSHILSYQHYSELRLEEKYICLVEDDIKTFKVQQQVSAPFVVSPLMKQCRISRVIGASHGLMCLFGFHNNKDIPVLVIWNPTVGKSFGIALPRHDIRTNCGFGVCPVTSDPTVVKFVYPHNMPWYVEVFTLSSGVWNVIPNDKLPRQMIRLFRNTQVVINKFIYWGAWEYAEENEFTMLVSFDLITKEFNVVHLRDTLTNKLFSGVSISKLRGSLVVCGYIMADEVFCGAWVMENNSSFRRLFTIDTPLPVYPHNILGFKKNGELIIKTQNKAKNHAVLNVYDPCSQHIKNLGISGAYDSFFIGSYKESLLLLDHLDSHIYSNDN